MDAASPARITGIYRYPVKGLTPEQLAAPAQARPDAAGRPPLRHRERPLRLRSGRTEMAAKAAFPDADAGRVAGGAADPVRRCEPRPDHPPQRRRSWPRAISKPPKAGPRSSNSSPPRFAGQIKGPPKVLTSPGHSFSDVARKVVSIINLASVRAIETMVGAPVHPLALPRQPLCRGLAGLARIRPARPHAGDRRRPAQGGEADRPLRRRQCRSRHRRARSCDPARRCSAGSATAIAGSMPR